MVSSIATELINWYESKGRDLPWRGAKDPYAIWISEVMLQQTRVETVIPYFKRWMARFPDPKSLARAEEDDVLNAWEGLGYYRRARHLHQAAKILVKDYDSQLPRDVDELQKLPGIGPYTAGALASIAFNADVPAVDGNVKRVISRLFNVDLPLHTSQGKRRIHSLVGDHLPRGSAGTFNQALMDLGAQICTPRSPDCSACPLNVDCQARKMGVQELRPVSREKKALPHHVVTAAVIHKNRSVLLAKRPPDSLLGGMWEFPGGKQEGNESLTHTLQREIREELGVDILIQDKIGEYQHAYTHYSITLHAYRCTLASHDLKLHYHTDWAWVPLQTLEDYPMGKVDRLIAQRLQEDP